LTLVPDRHPVKYGTTVIPDVPGCYLLADAIASLMDRRYIKSVFLQLPPATLTTMLILAGVGCLLPIKLAERKALERPVHRRLLWLGLIGLSAACFIVMVMTTNYASVHLGMAGFSLLTPMIGSFWVEFARNRHRVLDRNRRTVEDVRPATDGTVTLASRQPTSHPETQ
jgi:hypothetical protein